MPIKKSASKELRKSKKRHLRNIKVASELKTLNKKFLQLIEEKKIEPAKKMLNELISKFNRAATKRIIPRNRAERKVSRLTKKLNKA